jgi:subtilisin family serine protease
MTRHSRRSGLFLTLLALIVAALAPAPALAASPSAQPTAAPLPKNLDVIVTFKDKPGKAATKAIERLGGKVKHDLKLIQGVGATVPRGQLKKLRADPAVAAVELDHTLVAFSDPPDYEYDNAWGVDRIGAQRVHLSGNTGQGVKLAIIDTGIDYIHDDPDDNPYVVDPEFLNNYRGGYDFFNNDDDPMDDNGHGTHVAGIIAAEHNGYLVTGVAPGVDLYALKILNESGEGEYSGLIAALGWAVDHDMDVVNMSLGAHEPSASLQAAVAAAYDAGVTMVAASGNIDLTNWQEIFYGCAVVVPAAYDQVIAVSFTGADNRLTGYSCTGPQVDFAAPGDSINSTVPTGTCMFCTPYGYNWLSGTSMASPHVAGVVALVLSAGITDANSNGLLADDVKAHLCANTSPAAGMATTDPRYPNWYGCGIVDADKALVDNPPPGGGGTGSAPTAVDDTATTNEDTPTDIAVLANDTDPDGDALSVTAVTDPPNGTATVNPDGTVHYVPDANYNGPDGFGYTVVDTTARTDTGSVAVTVTAVNDQPLAVNDTATTPEDVSALIDVLANDTDPDLDTLMLKSVGQPGHGTTVLENGKVRYTPAANYSGPDTFGYNMRDATTGTASASVAVTVTAVNDPPVANNDTATTAEDTSKLIDVRANDTDFDGGPLVISTVGSPSHGMAVIEAGQVRYTPAANYNGPDSFSYTVGDGAGGSASGTVSMTVTAVNDPPIAAADAATTPEDVSRLVNVLANDTDVDGGTLVISSVGSPSHGTTAIESGQVRYTPVLDYFGPDSFTYVVSDGAGGSATATVSMTVTSVPEANSMHVGDLDGSVSLQGKKWTARVTIRIDNATHGALANANVSGTWSGGASGTATCRTSVVGICTVSKASIPTSVAAVSFTITGVTLSGRVYDGAANHDADGDSTGTVIVVSRP